MAATDRRRHVRLKPSAEVPARVALLGDGPMREALDVIDISIGGMALASPVLKGSKEGGHMKLVIASKLTGTVTLRVDNNTIFQN